MKCDFCYEEIKLIDQWSWNLSVDGHQYHYCSGSCMRSDRKIDALETSHKRGKPTHLYNLKGKK